MDCIINATTNNHLIITKTLHFLLPISIFAFLFSYFSGFSLFFFFFTDHRLTFPLLDRNCMFLLCNAILAVLANNFKLNDSSSGLINYDHELDYGAKQIPDDQLPRVFEEAQVQDNAALVLESIDSPLLNVAIAVEKRVLELQQEQDQGFFQKESEEVKSGDLVLECFDWEEEQEDDDDEEEEEESDTSLEEDVTNNVRVSTEELNKNFDEFIRRMKEEIRIGGRRHMIAV